MLEGIKPKESSVSQKKKKQGWKSSHHVAETSMIKDLMHKIQVHPTASIFHPQKLGGQDWCLSSRMRHGCIWVQRHHKGDVIESLYTMKNNAALNIPMYPIQKNLAAYLIVVKRLRNSKSPYMIVITLPFALVYLSCLCHKHEANAYILNAAPGLAPIHHPQWQIWEAVLKLYFSN